MKPRPPAWAVAPVLPLLAAAVLAGQTAAPSLLLRADARLEPVATCGTTTRWELNGRLRADALASGLPAREPFMFDQDPPLVFAGAPTPLTLRNFSVVGDFPSVTFRRV